MILASLIAALALSAQPAGPVTENHERRGPVIARLDGAPGESWRACQTACGVNESCRSWTWRAAGARQPKGTLAGDLLPEGSKVGDVVRAEVEDLLDGIEVTSVLPPKGDKRTQPERIELLTPSSDGPLVTTTRVKRRRDERDRGPRRGRDRDRGERGERRDRGERSGKGRRPDDGRARGGERDGGRERRSTPPPDTKPKPKRLRPGKAHKTELLETLKAEERPIAEQVLQGGIPAVRQAIEKQNEELKAAGKPEVNADNLLQVAERLRPKLMAAAWRDRADAALKRADEIDLRDLRSVVNAAGDAGRDEESRQVAEQLRTALAERVEAEQVAWVAEVAQNLEEERVVRALRLSSRPPKAGSPLPADLTQQLVDATSAALTSETGPQRWATVLDALAYSPIRRRVIPHSLPAKLNPELRETVARLATRLPEIAHIFDVSPEEAPARPKQNRRRGAQGKPQGKKAGDKKAAEKAPEKAEAPVVENGSAPATEASTEVEAEKVPEVPEETPASEEATASDEAAPAPAGEDTVPATDDTTSSDTPANG
jgi:hypothetical protein